MNFFGLYPATVVLGALALTALLVALHMLRVRLRRVEVDTLVFFELSGSVRQPRMLLRQPSRWLALLLSVLIALALWGALSDPRTGLSNTSRIIIVEPAQGELLTARVAEARRWCDQHGLGPRGSVIGAGFSPQRWLACDEPSAWLERRARQTPPAADEAARLRALEQASAELSAGDEIIWIGDAPPLCAMNIPVRTVSIADGRVLRWYSARYRNEVSGAGEPITAQLLLAGMARAPLELELRALDATELDRVAVPVGAFEVGLRLDATACRVGCELRARSGTVELSTWSLPGPLPEQVTAPTQIAIAEDLEATLQHALRAVIELDPRTALADSSNSADLLVSAEEVAGDARPQLIVSAGSDPRARRAECCEDAPIALSLRDRDQREANALAGLRGTTWVEDMRSGAQLVRAEFTPSAARIEMARWLLEPITHSDVPLLLATAFDFLVQAKSPLLMPRERGLHLPAATTDVVRFGAQSALPYAGRAHFVAPPGSAAQVQAAHGTYALATLDAVPSSVGMPPQSSIDLGTPFGGSGSWLRVLLLGALILFVFCSIAFHRGRMP